MIAVSVLATAGTVAVAQDNTQDTSATGVETRDAPCAEFRVSPESPVVGERIRLTVTPPHRPSCKVHYVDGYIESYLWYFGDSPVAGDSGRTAVVTFEEPGEYTIGLEARDHLGVTTLHEKTIRVTEAVPRAMFTHSPEEPSVGQEVEFDASSSFIPDGDIGGYTWEMGDGTTATGETVSHSYDETGEYDVTLTVEGNGVEETTTETVTVGDVSPVADIQMDADPDDITVDDTVTFDGSGSHSTDGEILNHTWEFGDGGTAEGETAEYSYTEPGAYEMTLEVDDGEDTATATKRVTVISRTPEPQVSYSPQEPVAGSPMTFDASDSHSPDGEIQQVVWEFGDGNEAVGMEVEHTYDEPGEYEVTVEVDDGVESASGSFSVTVGEEESQGMPGFGAVAALAALLLALVAVVAGRRR